MEELYQIIRESEFDKKIQQLAKSYKRLDDIDSCIDDALKDAPTDLTKLMLPIIGGNLIIQILNFHNC